MSKAIIKIDCQKYVERGSFLEIQKMQLA